MPLRKIALTAFVILHSFASFANDENSPYYSDAGSWNTFNVSYGFNKRFSLLFTQEFRLKENYTRLNLFYTNLGVEYKISKKLKTSLVYRLTDKFLDDNTFSFRHRFMWDATVKIPYKKFSFSYRHRLQVEYKNLYSSETGSIPEWYSRSKFEIAFKATKKISPYFSAEFRYQICDIKAEESQGTWHRTRYQLGIDYQYSERSKFGIYYLIQNEYNVSIPENQYITGLEYSLSLGK